jgi:hypothetical protein
MGVVLVTTRCNLSALTTEITSLTWPCDPDRCSRHLEQHLVFSINPSDIFDRRFINLPFCSCPDLMNNLDQQVDQLVVISIWRILAKAANNV